MRNVGISLLATLALSLAVSMRADEPAGEAVSTNGAKFRTAADAVNWNNGVPYTYDPSGNIRSIGTDDYFYDAAGRLIFGETDGVPRNFEYDAFGNRTRCLQNQGAGEQSDCQWGYNTISPANNRVSGLGYDLAGNVTSFGTHVYSYDATGMQTRDADGTVIREYIYTADDERIAVYETAPQTWRWTVRDTSSKVLRELTSTGVAGTSNWKWEKDYVWRDGLLLATRQIEPGGSVPVTYHYHLDHLGSPRRITNGQDQIAGVHDYHAFGPRLPGGLNEPSPTRMKYTGHERDSDTMSVTALDYMHARYYAPNLGRFLSVDPVLDVKQAMKNPQGWNRYSYVRNNPVNSVDPDGRLTIIVHGTYSDGDWAKQGTRFNSAVSKTFGEQAEVLPWSGRNTSAARNKAAAQLKGMIDGNLKPGEKLNIVAHSHGGNVVKAYSNNADSVQIFGGADTPRLLGNLAVGGWPLAVPSAVAGRSDPMARNVEVGSPAGVSHSDLHTPEAWNTVMGPP